jgi:uncharacterized MnhB-related membrane protein
MKDKELSQLTIEDLLNQKKQQEGIVKIITIILVIATAMFVGFIVKTDRYSSLTLLGIVPLVIVPRYTKLKKINDEIKSRNAN